MSEGPYDPLSGMPRRHPESVERPDYQDVLDKAEELFEAEEYAAAFNLLASRLEAVERARPAEFGEEQYQRPARRALRKMWESFVREIESATQRALRVSSQNELTVEDMKRLREDRALGRAPQRAGAAIARSEEIYRLENEHVELTGEHYNTILPMLRRKIEGYLKPVMKGDRGYSNYLPVTGGLVRAMVSNYLDRAIEVARILGAADIARDKAVDEARRGR